MDTTVRIPVELANAAASAAARLKPEYPRARVSSAAVLRAYAAARLNTRAGLSPLERMIADGLDALDANTSNEVTQ